MLQNSKIMGRTRNDSAEFVGLEALKVRHSQQLESFEQWASERDWTAFHSSHYDWWMFPYGCHSGAYGAAYAIYEHEAEILKQDKEFIKRFLRGVELLMLSWGWDLYGKCEIDNPDPDQCWQDWPIRLYKCAKSLKLFGFEEEFKSVREYAIPLIKAGLNFQYRSRDCAAIFLK